MDMIASNKLFEISLAHDCVADANSGKLYLSRTMRYGKVVNEPVIKRSMILEFQCAQGMGNSLNRVGLTMCPIVSWVDAPSISSPMMVDM